MKGTMEENSDVKFLFEKIGTALGIPEVLGDITAGYHLKSDRTPLKGSVQAENALAMGVVQSLGNANDGSKAAGDALVGIGEPGISGVMAVRL